jgi:hypothetical protein
MNTDHNTVKNRVSMRKKKPAKLIPGPKPDILKLEGDWQESVKKSLTKKRPLQGWPKKSKKG